MQHFYQGRRAHAAQIARNLGHFARRPVAFALR